VTAPADRAAQAGVLLVDDRRENLVAMEAVLAPLDCRLVSVTSGRDALKALLQDDFAVILLDVQMPDLDGFETAQYIKRRERTRTVPIIFVTAISKERHHVFRGYASGAVDYVFKPYDPVVLRSKVGVFLDLDAKNRALARSEGIQRATFDHAPIGMARLDRAGGITAVNAALCATLGVSPADLAGRRLAEVTHPADAGRDAARWEELLNGRRAGYEVEKRLVASPGARPVPVLVSFSLAGERGDLDADIVAAVLDLRERRRAEREREQLIREQAARAEAEAVTRRLEAIQRVTDATLASLGLDELLGELAARISEVLSADSVAFVLSDEQGGYVVRAASGVEATVGSPAGADAAAAFAERVLATGEAVVVDAVATDEGLDAVQLGQPVSSLLGVPLRADGRMLGALHVGTLFERRFTDEDASLLQLAADRAAMAIQRARLFEREHDIAQRLQRSLLPERLPLLPGISLSACYLPGGAGTQVGGDWYDAIPLPGGRLALVIGDVAGRGIEAASTMGQLRSALRAYALEQVDPGAIAQRLNAFVHSLNWETMVTLLLVVVDPATSTIRYANAGHPPPLVMSPDGTTRYLEGGRSVPLGAVEAPTFEEAEEDLEPGATLLLYTDGLVELPGERLDEGFARLAAAAAGASGADLERLCQGVIGDVLGAGGSDDDATLLALRSVSAGDDRVLLTFTGEPAALAAMRASVRRWLEASDVGDQGIADVTLACNEACQNAIEHGYQLRPEPLDVELVRGDGELVITVRDRGRWREPRDDDGDRGRGRGLVIMRTLMDAVDVTHGAEGTTVTLRKRLRAAGRGG
jgi:PAS domain S-box-containing protein